jgi:hypothetical protein
MTRPTRLTPLTAARPPVPPRRGGRTAPLSAARRPDQAPCDPFSKHSWWTCPADTPLGRIQRNPRPSPGPRANATKCHIVCLPPQARSASWFTRNPAAVEHRPRSHEAPPRRSDQLPLRLPYAVRCFLDAFPTLLGVAGRRRDRCRRSAAWCAPHRRRASARRRRRAPRPRTRAAGRCTSARPAPVRSSAAGTCAR